MNTLSTIDEADYRVRIGDRISIASRGKKKIYCADFYLNGRHVRRSLKTANLKIARQRAIQLEAQFANGEYATPRKPVAVRDAKERFIKRIKDAGRARKTVVAYGSEVNTFVTFLEARGILNLSQIEKHHFLDYQAMRQRLLAEKTLYTRLVIVKTFLNWCSGDGDLLDANPFKRCKVRRPYVTPKYAPTLAIVNAILDKARAPRLAQLATLAFTGLRVGELAMLRPQDVDLQQGWIRVVAREGWVPKTRQARKVPLHACLKQILDAYFSTIAVHELRAYVFSDQSDGTRPINVRTINVDLQKLAKQLGVPVGRKLDGIVVHSMRHFFETQAVDSGVPQFVVDQWMGHAGHQSMGRIYYGFNDQKSAAFMEQVKF